METRRLPEFWFVFARSIPPRTRIWGPSSVGNATVANCHLSFQSELVATESKIGGWGVGAADGAAVGDGVGAGVGVGAGDAPGFAAGVGAGVGAAVGAAVGADAIL